MVDKPMKFTDSSRATRQLEKEAAEKLDQAGLDIRTAAHVIRDAKGVAFGYLDPQQVEFQRKYENQQNLLEFFQKIADENKPLAVVFEDLKDYEVVYHSEDETTIIISEKLANDIASVIESKGEITNPEASRDTATKDIPSKSDSNRKYPTPPDEIRAPFTSAVDAKSIGAMLSEARNEAGMTKVAVAEAMGKDEKTIRNLEKGQHNSTLPKIQEYADILGYDLEFRLVPRDNS